jgi:serine/threonine protein kinase
MRTRPPFPPGTTISKRYQIVKQITSDSDFVTYGATDQTSKEAVVVRELQLPLDLGQQILQRLTEEAQALVNLGHTGIPRYLEHLHLVESDVLRFITVQQAVQGQNLALKVLDGWRPDEKQLRELAMQLLDILSYLRGQRPPLVHRDIRPEHIVLEQEGGKAHLVGFGGLRDLYHETVSGGRRWVGIPGYMAPERVRGQAFPASDLYGLGGTLIYTLTRTSPAQLPQRRLKADFRQQAQTSERLAEWIDRLQEPLVEERFQSPDEALMALRRPVPMEDVKPPSQKGLMIPALIGGNALLAVLLIVFIALYATSGGGDPDEVGEATPASDGGATVAAATTAAKQPTSPTPPGMQPGTKGAPAPRPAAVDVKRTAQDMRQPPVRPNHALRFDGAGAFTTEASDTLLPTGRAVTLEAWFKVSSQGRAEVDLPANDRPSMLLIKLSGGAWGFYLRVHDRAVVFGGAGQLATPRMVRYGQWHHVAGSYDFKTRAVRVYFDGTLVGSAKGLRRDKGDDVAAAVTIGALASGSKALKGFSVAIDEVRYWTRRRGEKRISATLEYELSGRERGLKGYWTFNEGAGKRSVDRTPDRHDGKLVGRGGLPRWVKENPF